MSDGKTKTTLRTQTAFLLIVVLLETKNVKNFLRLADMGSPFRQPPYIERAWAEQLDDMKYITYEHNRIKTALEFEFELEKQ